MTEPILCSPLMVHQPMPTHVQFYISVVRYGQAGWGAGPCGTDLAYIESAVRSYTSIDAARIYPVKLPVPAVGDI